MAEEIATIAEHDHIGRTFHAGCPACEERRARMATVGRERMDLERRIAALEEEVQELKRLIHAEGPLARDVEDTATGLRRLKSEFDIHRLHHNDPYQPGRGTGR